MRKWKTNSRFLSLVVVSSALSVFYLPWQLAKIITGSVWQNTGEFSKNIQQGLLSDFSNNFSNPGYGSSSLVQETRFWFWFHLTKSLLSIVLLVALFYTLKLLKTSRVIESKMYLKFIHTFRQLVISFMFLVSFLIVAANIQGTFAPLSSVLSFLPADRYDKPFLKMIEGLKNSLDSNNPNALAIAIIRDFSTYHAVVAIIFCLTSLLLAVLTAKSASHRNYHLGFTYGLFLLGFGLLSIANISTAIHPVPALNGFLSGI